MKICINLKDTRGRGSKARNLGAMARQGFRVPEGFIIPSAFFDGLFQSAPLFREFSSLPPPLKKECLPRLQSFIRAFDVYPMLAEDLMEIHALLGEKVMVRSSASGEDSCSYSFAGLFTSCHGGPSAVETARAALEVWASLWSLQAYVYREERGLKRSGHHMDVIIQKEIIPCSSGVLFTGNPVTGAREMVVNAWEGKGEELVSGRITPHSAILPRHPGVPPSGEGDSIPFIRPFLAELIDRGQGLETFFSAPQDIEWAYDGLALHIIQSRPLTAGRPVRWSREVLADFLPRRLTPLSAHIWQHYFEARLRNLYEELGASLPDASFVRQWNGALYLNDGLLEEITRSFSEPEKSLRHFDRALSRLPRLGAELESYRSQLERLIVKEKKKSASRRELFLSLVDHMKKHDPMLRVTYLLGYIRDNLAQICRESGEELISRCLDALPASVPGEWFPFQQMLLSVAEGSAGSEGILSRFGAWAACPFELAEMRLGEDPEALPPLIEKLKDDRFRDNWKRSLARAEIERQQFVSIVEEARVLYRKGPDSKSSFVCSLLEWLSFLVYERERHRYYTYRAAGCLRALLLSIAEEMTMAPCGDVFFLTLEELPDMWGEQAVDPCWRIHLEERRRFFHQPLHVPDVFTGVFPKPPLENAPAGGEEMKALVLQKGFVTAPARVVKSASDLVHFEPGEILIAPNCEPFWSIIFPMAAGFASETGGVLSHIAILAREYCIPSLSGVAGITDRIRTGDMVTIDGDLGTIRLPPASGCL